MQQPSSREQWYALTLRTHFEKVVALLLRRKGYEEYLPTYRSRQHWADRMEEIELPLFPGYIFCKFDVTDMFPVLLIPGVTSVVSFGGLPVAVPETEIAAVQRIVNSGMDYGPWPGIGPSQTVQVNYGPLRGLEGTLIQVKENYNLVISIKMLRRSVSVEIDRDCVTPVHP